jgi:hypothetical protein
MNDSESDAMWKLYMRGVEGVAIQTTVERLINCFAPAMDNVYLGKVEYVDHNTLAPSGVTISDSDYMLKRLAFQHEKEVRACVMRPDVRPDTYGKYFDESGIVRPLGNINLEDIILYPHRSGIFVDVDVTTLIENIVISPLSPKWFSDLVISLIDKLHYNLKVAPSEMSRPSPRFQQQ